MRVLILAAGRASLCIVVADAVLVLAGDTSYAAWVMTIPTPARLALFAVLTAIFHPICADWAGE